jgi:acetyl-CoA carboxylase carboxyl transferase subunit alpha
MAVNFLDFEQPIAELEAKIEELGHLSSDSQVNIEEEMGKLRSKSRQLTRSIFSSLTPWQITQLARHPQRPYALDYIGAMRRTSGTVAIAVRRRWPSSAVWRA